jgi:nicotinate-nucleotide adenylyltransferase
VTVAPRLGVIGGSFDPPHLAHLAIASEAAHAVTPDGVVFVPAAAPPHKEGVRRTPAEKRLEMTSLAIAGDERFSVSAIEIERGLVYTADMLAALREERGCELVFILGADSLLQLETWHAPKRLLSLCTLAVAPRPGTDGEAIAAAARRWGVERITLLDLPTLGLSSTMIRHRAAAGRPIRYLVPRRVEEYVLAEGLYR